jgi:hypothetical protein
VEKHGEIVLEEKHICQNNASKLIKKYGEIAYCGIDALLEALCQPVKLCKYRTVLTFVDQFTATGAPPAVRSTRILPINQYV